MRPVFLALFEHVLRRTAGDAGIDELIVLGRECLSKAMHNLRIFASLSRAGNIGQLVNKRCLFMSSALMLIQARYGFWESLHLFSALKIFSLATLMYELRPFEVYDDDAALVVSSRALLHDMAVGGNFAAKGHCKMLEEVDQIVHDVVRNPITFLDDYGNPRLFSIDEEMISWPDLRMN